MRAHAIVGAAAIVFGLAVGWPSLGAREPGPPPSLVLDCATKRGDVTFAGFAGGFIEVRISHDDILVDPETGEDDVEEVWYVARVYGGGCEGIEHVEFSMNPEWWYRAIAQRKTESVPQGTHWMKCP